MHIRLAKSRLWIKSFPDPLLTASPKSASRMQWGRDQNGACHTIASKTPIAPAVLGVMFAGPGSAETKGAGAEADALVAQWAPSLSFQAIAQIVAFSPTRPELVCPALGGGVSDGLGRGSVGQ